MSRRVLIAGGGIAASACQMLLKRAGYEIALENCAKPLSPVLLLSAQTQVLLRDIFACESLLSDAIQVNRRVVAWNDGPPVEYPHSALVISEQVLLSRLWDKREVPKSSGEYAATVYCSRRPGQLEFGSRQAFSSTIRFTELAYRDACFVEAVDHGWLFLIPAGEGIGSLISVGDEPEVLLRHSRFIGSQIASSQPPSASFTAHPRIAGSLCGLGWIACGGAAVGFDPIAGEGSGHALRQAVLAAAIIRAVDDGLPEPDLNAHYSARILKAFGRHLDESARFYQAARGAWWERELSALQRGQAWVRSQVAQLPLERFRLNGFEIERF